MLGNLEDLVQLGEAGLRDLWRRGSAPAPDELVGWVLRGWNTSRAAARSPVGGRAFAKGFFRDGGAVHGCNFPVSLHGAEWHIQTDRPFGFFAVLSTEAGPWAGHRGLLLDYGLGREHRQPDLRLRVASRLARVLRDLVVCPPGAAPGLYVGRAYITSALKFPITCFALQRWRPLRTGSGPSGPRPPAWAREHVA